MSSERLVREEMCGLARTLYDRGHNAPGDGNLSFRLSERYILCTPTMRHKGRLAPADLVKVRIQDGRSVDLRQKASSEIRMHLAIFSARPDVRAIIHAHSPNTVALSVAGISMDQPVVPEAILALGGIPTVPYESPTTEDVASAVLPYARRSDAFILERHGPVALGATLAEAFSRLEVIEHTARITVTALAVGSATPIPDAEAARLRQMARPPDPRPRRE